MSPEVHVGAPTSSNEDFLGFPGHTAYLVATGCGRGAAFNIDVADGDPVAEPLARTLWIPLCMIPHERRASCYLISGLLHLLLLS